MPQNLNGSFGGTVLNLNTMETLLSEKNGIMGVSAYRQRQCAETVFPGLLAGAN